MKNRAKEIISLLEADKQDAYRQGWDDAMATIQKAAVENAARPPAERVPRVRLKLKKRRGRRTGTASETVEKFIAMSPGCNGAEVARALPDVPERTVRTALRRLRLNGRISQDATGGWRKA